MGTIQSLKKQLRSIRSTQKLTKAMKTVSTVKFSKLNGMYGNYAPYGEQCKRLLAQYAGTFSAVMGQPKPEAPPAVVILTGNKGLCGNFNMQVLQHAKAVLQQMPNALVIACGKKATAYCKQQKIPLLLGTALEDLPTYEQANGLFDQLLALREQGKVSELVVVYPRYRNMMIQVPEAYSLFASEQTAEQEDFLYVPDRTTVEEVVAQRVFRALFYHLILQTALGAQAATLMTMRSAYETATEYCADLEGQINRQRQSAVTADVIETSAERNTE